MGAEDIGQVEVDGFGSELDVPRARDFFEELRRCRDDVVPLVGAGLSVAAGGLSTSDLRERLRSRAEHEGVGGLEDLGVYELADRLAEWLGTSQVNNIVAEATKESVGTPTPTLLALVRVPSRIVLTTNWDDLIERAVERAGLTPRTFALPSLAEGIRPGAPDEVNVLHLHGVASDPSTIVLTSDSYERARADEQLALALRALAVRNRLLLFGHGLDDREVDLSKHLPWSVDVGTRARPHLLLASAGSDAAAIADEITTRTGVRVVAFTDPTDDHDYASAAARCVGLLSPHHAVEWTESIDERRLERPYLPLAVAPYDHPEFSPEEWAQWAGLLSRRLESPHRLDDPRLLLFGFPQTGKSETLLRLARESDRGLYRRLGNLRVPGPGETAEAAFVSWMHEARSVGTDVPRFDHTLLRKGAVDIFLDGLDEVPGPDRRVQVVRVIETLANRYPQHRWVVSTRPLQDLLYEDVLTEFARHFLAVPSGWLDEYLELRGHHPSALAPLYQRLPAAIDLVRSSPFYAEASVEVVESNEPVPATALDLGLYLADRGLHFEESRLPAPPDEVGRWLNRLALALELLGRTHMGREELLHSSLHAGLGFEPGPELLDRLVERTLLDESGDGVRFISPSIQEIRAAAELLARDDGRVLLERFVVGEVAGRPHVWGSFVHSLELLLGSADAEWRDWLARFDPCAVARTIALDAPVEDRLAAIETIWSWYVEHRVWLPRSWGPSGRIPNDLDAIGRLGQHGACDGSRLLDDIRRALGGEEHTDRGNALFALLELDDRETARAHLPRLVDDANPVVARRAANVAAKLGATELTDVLAERAGEIEDGLQRRVFSQAAVHIAPDDRLPEILDRLPRSEWDHVLAALDQRVDRDGQLAMLNGRTTVDEGWVQHLLRSEEVWSEEQVSALASVIHSADRSTRMYLTSDARDTLVQHPRAALREFLRGPIETVELWELTKIVRAIGRGDLESLLRESAADAETTRFVLDLHDPGGGTSAVTPPSGSSSRSSVRSSSPTSGLADLIDQDSAVDVVFRDPDPEELAALDRERYRRLIEMIQTYRNDLARDQDRSPLLGFRRTGERAWNVSRVTLHLLTWWEALDLEVSFDEWFGLATSGLATHPSRDWLQRRFRTSWWRRLTYAVIDSLPDGVDVEALVRALPLPWPAGRARHLTARCVALDCDPEAKRRCVEALKRGRQWKALRKLLDECHDEHAAIALAELGNCPAERWLLERWIDANSPIDEHDLRVARPAQWLRHIRCLASAKLLEGVLLEKLRAGTQAYVLRPVFEAFERAAGSSAVRTYDEWRHDDSIPAAPFLISEVERALNARFAERVHDEAPEGLTSVVALLTDAEGGDAASDGD